MDRFDNRFRDERVAVPLFIGTAFSLEDRIVDSPRVQLLPFTGTMSWGYADNATTQLRSARNVALSTGFA
jgi:hypothetical protein